MNFADEKEIIEEIKRQLEQVLNNANTSRTFATHPVHLPLSFAASDRDTDRRDDSCASSSSTSSLKQLRAAQHKMVRTDSREQTIDAFVDNAPPLAANRSTSSLSYALDSLKYVLYPFTRP